MYISLAFERQKNLVLGDVSSLSFSTARIIAGCYMVSSASHRANSIETTYEGHDPKSTLDLLAFESASVEVAEALRAASV
jgi:hypothetical protein